MEKSNEVTTVEEGECASCEDTYRSLLDLAPGVKVCAFCGLYLEPAGPLPELPTLDGEVEFMGAWGDFANDVVQYHLGIFIKYRQTKHCHADAIKATLRTAVIGGTLLLDTTTLWKMWDLLVYERIMERLEVAHAYAEQYSESWAPEACRQVVELPEIKPVWELWLRTAAAEGKEVRKPDNVTMWYAYGKHHRDSRHHE